VYCDFTAVQVSGGRTVSITFALAKIKLLIFLSHPKRRFLSLTHEQKMDFHHFAYYNPLILLEGFQVSTVECEQSKDSY